MELKEQLKATFDAISERMKACKHARKVCNEAGQHEQARVWNEKLKEGAYYRDIIEEALPLIQSYGKEQYNKALIDAAKNADVEYMFGDEWQVDQQSILKLKKP